MNGLINRVFYTLKPLIPRTVQIGIRRWIACYKRRRYAHVWPIDPAAAAPPPGWKGWPEGKQFAFVLSHDVDTAKGYRDVLKLAEIEERLGFRSCFNFVPERYGKISLSLLDELKRRGFGVGVHGLKHDGKLFMSKEIFDRSAKRINAYLAQWGCRGFSSPSMHHNLDWLPELNIDYSISTFDTDPFEPQPDSIGTIFPFLVPRAGGRRLEVGGKKLEVGGWRLEAGSAPPSGFCSSPPSLLASQPPSFIVELPYTLPQDSTLFIILQEKGIDIWKRKLDWVAEKGGMVLFNTHPDYMTFNGDRPRGLEYPVQHYTDFLQFICNHYAGSFVHLTPEKIGHWFAINTWKADCLRGQ